jgi:hypothetical protein
MVTSTMLLLSVLPVEVHVQIVRVVVVVVVVVMQVTRYEASIAEG